MRSPGLRWSLAVIALLLLAVITAWVWRSPGGVSISDDRPGTAKRPREASAVTLDAPSAPFTAEAPVVLAQPVEQQRPAPVAERLEDAFPPPARWFWQDGQEAADSPPSWEQALQDAEAYRRGSKLDRLEFMRHYQRILDAKPPLDVEIQARLEIGGAMIIYFPDFMDREALPWYVAIVRDAAEIAHHRSAMVAKVHLGDLLHRNFPRRYDAEIDQLYREVLSIPPDDIIFDHPSMRRFNMEAILAARHPEVGEVPDEMLKSEPGQRLVQRLNEEHLAELLRQRAEHVTHLRSAAARAWTYKKIEPGLPEVSRERLLAMRGAFPGDPDFESALDEALSKVGELSGGRRRQGSDDIPWDEIMQGDGG